MRFWIVAAVLLGMCGACGIKGPPKPPTEATKPPGPVINTEAFTGPADGGCPTCREGTR